MWPKRINPKPRFMPARGRKNWGLPAAQAKALEIELETTFSTAGISMQLTGRKVHLRWREGHETSRELAPLLEDIADGAALSASVDEFVAKIIRYETETVARGLTLSQLYRGAFMHLDAKRGGEWGSFSLDLARYLVVGGTGSYLRLPAYEVRKIDDDIQTIVEIARKNLFRALDNAQVDVQRRRSGPGGEYAYVLRCSSPHWSSMPLFLDWCVQRFIPGEEFNAGILFAVPQPDMVLIRPVTYGNDLAEGMATMAGAALTLFAADKRGISPRLHVSVGGEIHAISDVTDNSYLLYPTDYLVERIKGT